MSSHRQALKPFWVATLVRTTDANWSPDATNDSLVSSTTSYTCTFHLQWMLLGRFPVPAQFLLAGILCGDDHHKQFQKEIIPLFAVHSIMFSGEQCLFVSHYCLFFWFSATKHLGHPIRDASAVTAITCSTGVQHKKPKHCCICSCSTRCEYLQLPSLPLWPYVQYLFNPCVHWKNICPQRQSPHLQTQTTHLLSRAFKGTTAVTKQSQMWDQQNVCTGWWYMHQQAFRSPLHCESLHWSRSMKHSSIIPRHAHKKQCDRWMCPWVLHVDRWASSCEKPLCS
jgi:hypothetical protein